MAKFGEKAVQNAIKLGREEIHSVITGQPMQEAPAAEAPKMSYEQALAETAREPVQGQEQTMER